jgi:hypothetical protein
LYDDREPRLRDPEDITRAKDILKWKGAADIASTGEKSVGAYAATAHDSKTM